MSLLQMFLDRIADSIADGISKGIDRRISDTKITVRVRDVKSIDELVNVVENTCFVEGRTVKISYNRCPGYSVQVFDIEGQLIHKIDNCRTMKILYEELLTEMVNGKGN